MALRNSDRGYGLVAITFHWAIAMLIMLNLALGLFVAGLPAQDPARFSWIPMHKSIGLAVLVLSLARLIWRLLNSAPAKPAGQPAALALAARCSVWLFYLFMIAVPLTGWAESTVAGYPASFFGLFRWPAIGPLAVLPSARKKVLAGSFSAGHACLAFTLMALLVLHVAAALYHHFLRRDEILRRMLLLDGNPDA